MADPIIVDHFRALAIFQGSSGLPEDRFVTTWAFRNDAGGTVEAAADNMTNALSEFFFGAMASGRTLAGYMPTAFTSWECRVYDLGQAPPRDPIINGPQHTQLYGSSSTLPPECAICLSLRTDERGPRGRGRVYLGPMGHNAGNVTHGLLTVSTTARDDIAVAAGRLMDRADVTWVLISSMDLVARPVTGGYIDDAWDTQRRRGLAPTARTPWGTYQVPA